MIASTSSNDLPGRGSEKALNECLGVSNGFPSAAQVKLWMPKDVRIQCSVANEGGTRTGLTKLQTPRRTLLPKPTVWGKSSGWRRGSYCQRGKTTSAGSALLIQASSPWRTQSLLRCACCRIASEPQPLFKPVNAARLQGSSFQSSAEC